MMRFASLGSGSRGNATLVQGGSTTIMVDCGFSVRETERRLLSLGCEGEQISAILVTHEHSDHIHGVSAFAARYHIPIWMSAGTLLAIDDPKLDHSHVIPVHASFNIGDLSIHPFPVPHDAREPCQFVFSHGSQRIGILTDIGHCTSCVRRHLHDLDALMLEFNHDQDMLSQSPYPSWLKRRVGGDYGHLGNHQALELLQSLDISKVQYLVAAHLSEKNNHPDLVREHLASLIDLEQQEYVIADQQRGMSWYCIQDTFPGAETKVNV